MTARTSDSLRQVLVTLCAQFIILFSNSGWTQFVKQSYLFSMKYTVLLPAYNAVLRIRIGFNTDPDPTFLPMRIGIQIQGFVD